MNRRNFLQTAAAGALASRLSPPAPRPLPPLSRIGIQLYAVRGDAERNLERTLAELARIGYTDVELLWGMGNFGRGTAEMRAMLDRAGLRAPSTHASASVIAVGWERHLDQAARLGHEYIVCPGFSVDSTMTIDDWKEWGDRFNQAGAAARKRNIWLGFHNEPQHFRPLDGQVPYDAFIQRTDPSVTRHQLDIGNAAMGGADPMALLARYRERYWTFHVKDVPVIGRMGDTLLGRGTLDLPGIMKAIPSPQQKLFFVEHNSEEAQAMENARRNFAYLEGLSL